MSADPAVHRARLRRVARARRRSELAWRSAIVAARDEAGMSHRAIALAAGVSHVRVIQIVAEQERRSAHSTDPIEEV